MVLVCFIGAVLLSFLIPAVPVAAEPPTIPVGLDAYRMWDRWPYQRIGARAYMRSTYDRTGGNEAADASHFLYQLADDYNVTLDVAGPGVLYFVRTNHWHGSPWHYEVDGEEHIVEESSSANPDDPVPNSVFHPEHLFPNPLTWTWSITRGADLMWVPIPFEERFRLGYSRTHYGTGYYIFHQYVPGANLSRPIRSWDGRTPPDPEVLELVNRAGTDIAPRPGKAGGRRLSVGEISGKLDLPAPGAIELGPLPRGPGMIRAFELSVPKEHAVEFGRARLRVTWDGRDTPSIDAPVALFFGTGTLYNRDDREYLVKGFPIHVRFDGERVHLACYYPMPYFKSANFELVGNGETEIPGIAWSIRSVPYKDPPNHVGYFHATYKDHGEPVPGKDLVLLETEKVEGGGDWSGQFVGMSWIFSHRGVLNTLEGDPRFFFDDSMTPQAYGTGTEEWGGGGDYWGGRNMTLPFAGHPVGCRRANQAKNDEDLIQSAYRFLFADLMPFGKNARIQLEHGGRNDSKEHYKSVVYWYGLPNPSLIRTDELDIGNPESEKSHGYRSPDASEPVKITSRYEWGVDTLNEKEIYPPHTEMERHTKTSSEFMMEIEPDNHGVLLRRTLDYSYPNQRAVVSVADGRDPDRKPRWRVAGVWYLAGSNTCVYSNPRPELGETQHIVQTSNRRFRDDEFLVPKKLTRGRSKIRVRVEFVPEKLPLFPGHPLPELAWSEIRYSAYSFVMPKFRVE